MEAVIMRIDFATLAFGYRVESGGNTPNWSTALGQGKEHKINNTAEIDEILKGMIYSGVSVTKTKLSMGRGGSMVSGSDPNTPIVLAAVFNKVFIDNTEISDGRFLLLITKDLSGTHAGRFKLKYGPSNAYDDGPASFTNQDFFNKVKAQLQLANDACWFVSDINIRNQDELVFRTFVVNKDGSETYADGAALHAAWNALAPFDSPYTGNGDEDVKKAENIILYGVPGSGKSYKIKQEYCNDEQFMERIIFHPDYTYSDFVGQILPENKDGKISYPFIPGPFTRILKKAVADPQNNYYLIIEEINRGNAPAIFGEIFQLLDRVSGDSEYGINNPDIARVVYGNAEHPVRIPNNLFLLATMNTADQNVFTLDTAFKRRWKMHSIPNDISKCQYAEDKICDTPITWASFLNTINNKIIEFGKEGMENEDKRLGVFFLSKEELLDVNAFSEKIFMYLWNDAFKYTKQDVFKSEYKTLEQLIDGFKKEKFSVFKDSFVFNNHSASEESSH